MSETIKAIILGVVQGLTEFLPVSSSGHLRFLEAFLDLQLENALAFDVAIHLATLIAVFAVFYNDIWNTIKGFVANLPLFFKNPAAVYKENADFRMAVFIIIATIPVVISGLLLRNVVSALPLFAVGMNLVITGVVLSLPFFFKKNEGTKTILQLSTWFAVIVGIAQAIAIVPGISRSGATITTALMLGANPALAGTFSFLMSIPAILGAAALELQGVSAIGAATLIGGAGAAFISGYSALRFLVRIIKRGKFYFFSFYCFAAGIAGIIVSIIQR